MRKLAVQKEKNHKKSGAPIAISIATIGLAVAGEFAMREAMKLAFTTKPSLMGRKMMSEPLFFVPKTDIHWLKEQQNTEDMECVTIRAFDGSKLTGHYFHGRQAKRVIIMAHGWRGHWYADFGMIAHYMHRMECDLLLIEERAQGSSEGEYMTFGVLEAKDIVRWADYLEARTDLPIYLYGVSMGAAAVLMASGKSSLTQQVKGVIADCGYTSPIEIVRMTAKGIHPVLPYFVNAVDRRCRYAAGFGLRDDSPEEALRHTKVPVFFVHGDSDVFVPLAMGERNYEACASKKHLLVVEGANHGESFVKEPLRYLSEMWEFFGWDPVTIVMEDSY